MGCSSSSPNIKSNAIAPMPIPLQKKEELLQPTIVSSKDALPPSLSNKSEVIPVGPDLSTGMDGVQAVVVKKKERQKAMKPPNMSRSIKDGNLEEVKSLLDSSPNLLEEKGMWDNTPLILACQYAAGPIALLLIDRGANVNVSNEKGCTPLLYCCLEGLEEVVKTILLKSDKPVYQCGLCYNSKKDTNLLLSPLEAAAINNHLSILTILLKNNYDPNIKSEKFVSENKEEEGAVVGMSRFAISHACAEGHILILNSLIEFKANTDIIDEKEGISLLMCAALSSNDKVLTRLLSTSASQYVNHIGRNNISPLYVASSLGLMNSVKGLLAKKAVVDFKNAADGSTPLYKAVCGGHEDIVSLLLAAGANPKVALINGKTALDAAKEINNELIVDLLQE